jgi:hypothetical protein
MTNRGHASVGVFYDRKDRQKHNDCNLGGDVKSEPKRQHRQKRYSRRRVDTTDVGRERPIEPNVTPDEQISHTSNS